MCRWIIPSYLLEGFYQGIDLFLGVHFGDAPEDLALFVTGEGQSAQDALFLQRLHDLLAEAFPAVQLSALPDTLYGLDLLVNGSPAGMAGFDELPLPQALLDTLDSTTHVADVVTAPVMTPLLTFAAARGCKVQTGPEMALAQMKLMGQFIGAIAQEQGAAA